MVILIHKESYSGIFLILCGEPVSTVIVTKYRISKFMKLQIANVFGKRVEVWNSPGMPKYR